MAKVRMLVNMTGTRQISGRQQDWPPRGEILEVTDDEAGQLIAGGMAEPIDAATKRQQAERRG